MSKIIQVIQCMWSSFFRWEIFHIHTRQMKENGFLADDVNIKDLAANTTQFSGAEIAGIVRLAASYALDRKVGGTLEVELLLGLKGEICLKVYFLWPGI